MKDDAYFREVAIKILVLLLAFSLFNVPGVIAVALWYLWRASKKGGVGGS